MQRIAITLVFAAACGASGAGGDDDDDVPAADADPGAPDADPNTPDASPGSPDAAPPPLPACYPTCATAADCAIGASTLYDADNYDCEDGTCRWTGCNTTAECIDAFGSSDYACDEGACLQTCGVVADCTGASTLYDADNYACNGGRCEWTGCNATAECVDAFMSSDYVCD